MEIAFLFWMFFAIACPIIASGKGRSAIGWFLLALPFGLFALILLVCLPSLKEPEWVKQQRVADQRAAIRREMTEKTCPSCAEQVKAAAAVCRFCGHEFPPEEPKVEAPKKPQPIPGQTWICSKCETENTIWAGKCKACSTPFEEAPSAA